MAKDLSTKPWHGIDRKEIPWFPTVDEAKCIGCELCYVSCGREVFEFDDTKNKAVVERPFNCMVGCSTCATICPSGAISFPPRELISKIEREHKILKIVRQEAARKKSKKALEEARELAEKTLLSVVTSVELEVTRHLAERQVFPQLHEVIKNEPCDILYITVETPTLKGCWEEKAPSYARFRLVSTEYADIAPYLARVKEVLKRNDVVVISEK
ncbi:MAG: 4Fe-4S dicluster domain-containing protein, partial [Calditrichaeota bacterium]|nr:4Fe-4S dicluster domain-containing protein [Calditrichota bacterium]